MWDDWDKLGIKKYKKFGQMGNISWLQIYMTSWEYLDKLSVKIDIS